MRGYTIQTATVHPCRPPLTFVAASNVFRTSLLKGTVCSALCAGLRFPDSDWTAARAFSAVSPLFRKPFLLPVSSVISPSRTCSVVTCRQGEASAGLQQGCRGCAGTRVSPCRYLRGAQVLRFLLGKHHGLDGPFAELLKDCCDPHCPGTPDMAAARCSSRQGPAALQ
jgi:hypothetical protein